MSTKIYNVRVLYLVSGRGDVKHLDIQVTESKPENLSYLIRNYVRILKQYARDGIQTGYKLAIDKGIS